jgi:hypothetical protein
MIYSRDILFGVAYMQAIDFIFDLEMEDDRLLVEFE